MNQCRRKKYAKNPIFFLVWDNFNRGSDIKVVNVGRYPGKIIITPSFLTKQVMITILYIIYCRYDMYVYDAEARQYSLRVA